MLTVERVAHPGNHAVPLALFCGGIVDQHAVHGAIAAIAAVVPDPVLANAGDHKEVGRDPSAMMPAGSRFLARNVAGESFAGLETDCTVRSARLSSVKKRRPVPSSGGPASRVKIETGMSTLIEAQIRAVAAYLSYLE
jgi:hypothetical protein